MKLWNFPTLSLGNRERQQYKVWQKWVYSCESAEQSLFLYYYLLIIISLSIQTSVNLLWPHSVWSFETLVGLWETWQVERLQWTKFSTSTGPPLESVFCSNWFLPACADSDTKSPNLRGSYHCVATSGDGHSCVGIKQMLQIGGFFALNQTFLIPDT